MAWPYSIAAVVLVSALSLVGVLTLTLDINLLRKLVLHLVSLAAGGLLGTVFFHILPEATEPAGFTSSLSVAVLVGILFSFTLEKIIRWRHVHISSANHPHPVAFINLFADGMHNFVDGMIIAASFTVSTSLGIATTVGVALHELPQEIGDFGILLHAGLSIGKALLLNLLTALTSVIGAVLALLIGSAAEDLARVILPFAAGNFLYIAAADLIPELQEHPAVRSSLIQVTVMIAGVAMLAALLLLE